LVPSNIEKISCLEDGTFLRRRAGNWHASWTLYQEHCPQGGPVESHFTHLLLHSAHDLVKAVAADLRLPGSGLGFCVPDPVTADGTASPFEKTWNIKRINESEAGEGNV
jgi:hypothetical protein